MTADTKRPRESAECVCGKTAITDIQPYTSHGVTVHASTYKCSCGMNWLTAQQEHRLDCAIKDALAAENKELRDSLVPSDKAVLHKQKLLEARVRELEAENKRLKGIIWRGAGRYDDGEE